MVVDLPPTDTINRLNRSRPNLIAAAHTSSNGPHGSPHPSLLPQSEMAVRQPARRRCHWRRTLEHARKGLSLTRPDSKRRGKGGEHHGGALPRIRSPGVTPTTHGGSLRVLAVGERLPTHRRPSDPNNTAVAPHTKWRGPRPNSEDDVPTGVAILGSGWARSEDLGAEQTRSRHGFRCCTACGEGQW
jgi:hypothetical protein